MCRFPFDTMVRSCAELEKIIDQVRVYRGISNFTEIYRGQGRDCWKLIPKIARQIKEPSKIEIAERNIICDFQNALKTEGLLHTISVGSNKGEFEAEWLIIQQAQHYELPTRFLDWSGRWEVSLCFAVSNETDDKCDGQFWIFFVPPNKWICDENNGNLNINPFDFKETIVLNSAEFCSGDELIKIAQRRKGTQRGRFCIQPYTKVITPLEDQEEFKPYLHKIIIPAKFKRDIREELTMLGITKDACMVSEPICRADREKYHETIQKIDKIVSDLNNSYIDGNHAHDG
jgi:hypothetical protein